MSILKVVSIVPRLPPAIDGVGDYAVNIARNLKKEFFIDTHFIVGNQDPRKSFLIETYKSDSVASRNSSSLDKILGQFNPINSIIFLNYATRAYGYKGCPLWILNSLKRYKSREGKIAIMFHEIYAQEARFMSSDFLMSFAQKQVVRAFTNLADQCFTNCENYEYALQKLNPKLAGHLITIPVPSTVGEPSYLKPLAEREAKLVIFGQGGNKMQAYKSAPAIQAICQSLEIKEILDIGPSHGVPKSIGKIPVTRLGEIAPQKISEILMNSIAGLLAYRHDRLGKSSIFASYCAHGILPVNLYSDKRDSYAYEHIDTKMRLIPGKHYLTGFMENAERQKHISDLQEVAYNAHAWYETHQLSVQSKIFSESLKNILTPVQSIYQSVERSAHEQETV